MTSSNAASYNARVRRPGLLDRRALRACGPLVLAMCSVARMASAQSPTAGADIDIVSRYIWRGVPYSDGAAVQPSVWTSVQALTLSLWSNLVVADRIDRGQFNHLFVAAAYRADAGRFTIEPGVQAWHTKAFGEVPAITTAEACGPHLHRRWRVPHLYESHRRPAGLSRRVFRRRRVGPSSKDSARERKSSRNSRSAGRRRAITARSSAWRRVRSTTPHSAGRWRFASMTTGRCAHTRSGNQSSTRRFAAPCSRKRSSQRVLAVSFAY